MNLKTWIAVAVTLLFWSSAFAGIRMGLAEGYSPGHLVLFRFLCASAVFVLYAVIRGLRLPQQADLPRIIALSLAGITVYHIALTFGEQTVPAGTASLIVAAAPAFSALLARFALGERLNRTGWIGIALGFIGTALITFGAGQAFGVHWNALLIVLSAVSASLFFVYQKPLFERYSAVELTAYFTWLGTIPLLVFAPGLVHAIARAPLPATLSVVYIGVFPAAVAYVAWATALASGRTQNVTSTLYINPVLAILIAWVWLNEWPHWMSLVGGVVAVMGVVLVNRKVNTAAQRTI